MFIFIWQCTRLLSNKIHSVNVTYIIDYKVQFPRYIRIYKLSERGHGDMIFYYFQNSLCDLVSFRFVSFLSLYIMFRFVSQLTDFVSFRRVSFRVVSFLFRFSLYRDPFYNRKKNKLNVAMTTSHVVVLKLVKMKCDCSLC